MIGAAKAGSRAPGDRARRHRERRRKPAIGLAALLTLAAGVPLLSSCSGAGAAGESAAGESGQRVVVLAASSLTEPFDDLAVAYERTHPGVDVVVSYGSSATLATQVTSGFPADVFAAASDETMAAVVTARAGAAPPRTFARNRLAVAVPAGNPAGVQRLADLGRGDVAVAVCQPEAPCGAAAQRLFSGAGLSVDPATWEPDVRAVLGKVQLGEVDAGVVYASDVTSAGDTVASVPIPRRCNVTTSYPITTLDAAPAPEHAEAFVELVTSPAGQRVLRAAGFRAGDAAADRGTT